MCTLNDLITNYQILFLYEIFSGFLLLSFLSKYFLMVGDVSIDSDYEELANHGKLPVYPNK